MWELAIIIWIFTIVIVGLVISSLRRARTAQTTSQPEENQDTRRQVIQVDAQGKSVGARDEDGTGRRRIIIPGFRAALSAFVLSDLDQSVGVASYHPDDKYFGLQVMGDWLNALGINDKDLLIFHNSREFMPDHLVVYSHGTRDFNIAVCREVDEKTRIVQLLNTDNEDLEINDNESLKIYGYMLRLHPLSQVQDYYLPGN